MRPATQTRPNRRRVSIDTAFGRDAHAAHTLLAHNRTGTFAPTHFDALERLVTSSADPAAAAAAILGGFGWVSEQRRPVAAYSPSETTQRTGVCRDQHTLAAYWLAKAGYPVVRFSYGSPDTLHSFLLFRDPVTRTIGAIEYGNVHRFESGVSAEDALQVLNPGALAFTFQSTPADPNERSFDRASVLTPQGRRLVNDMLGADAETATAGSALRVDSSGFRVRLQSGDGVVVDAIRYAADSSEPVLNDGVAIALRYVGKRQTVSVGFVQLRDIPYRAVGSRQEFQTDSSMGFISYSGRGDLFRAFERPGFRITVPGALTLHTALPFSDAASGVDKGIAVAATGGEADMSARTELTLEHWLAAVELGVSLNRSTIYNLIEGGYMDPIKVPVRLGPRLELAYRGAVVSVDARADVSLTEPIDLRRSISGILEVGVDLARIDRVNSAHALSASVALQASHGRSVIPFDDSRSEASGTAAVRYGFRLGQMLSLSAEGRLHVHAGMDAPDASIELAIGSH